MKDLQQLSQAELIQIIQQKDTTISAMEEQLLWYKNQIQLQQKKLFGRSSEKVLVIINYLYLMKQK